MQVRPRSQGLFSSSLEKISCKRGCGYFALAALKISTISGYPLLPENGNVLIGILSAGTLHEGAERGLSPLINLSFSRK